MRCGFASQDITPSRLLPMAGWSADGKRAVGVAHPLWARAFVFEHDQERVAFCVLDLFASTRALLDAVVGQLDGFDHAHVVLVGTHTHAGPGHIFGGTIYDAVAQRAPGSDPDLVSELARGIAEAIRDAADNAIPAEISYGQAPLWGLSRNASPAAFLHNPESTTWSAPGFPGHGAPTELPFYRRVVDPRLRALVIRDPSDGRRRAALCFFACHNTALGADQDSYSPDWYGAAVRQAQDDLGMFIALAPGPGSDANASQEHLPAGPRLLEHSGALAAAAIGQAVRAAGLPTQGLEVRLHDTLLSDRRVGGDPDTELAREPVFGKASLGGGQEGRSLLWHLGVAQQRRPSDRFPVEHPQHPKGAALWPAQRLLREALAATGLNRSVPLHQVRLGDVLLVTLPGEPSAVVGWRLERALLQATGARQVVICGYAGDYIGYITTAQEYAQQCYEGASTLLGRHTAAHLQARHLRLAQAHKTPRDGRQ